MSYNVFVDATILGKHSKDMPKRTFVAYFVEGRPDLQEVKEVTDVGADETHEAELHAVLFAVEQLNTTLDRFAILCDHESIVSEINREDSKLAKSSMTLQRILEWKRNNPRITIKRTHNPAHALLDQYLLKHGLK